MRRLRIILYGFITAALTFITPVFAQQTAVYRQPVSDFRNAADLLAKEKYGAAMVIYERLANTPAGENQGIRSASAYYSALCATRLFHDDAMYRMDKFTRDYPESSNMNAANYELAKLQYNAKDYKDAIASFNQVDVFELTPDELAEFQFKLGYCYLKTDNLDKAKGVQSIPAQGQSGIDFESL